jgi:hypothetical protein
VRAPIPGEQFVEAFGRVIRQTSERVREPSLRIDVVELGGCDQRVDGGGAAAAFVGAGEGPVLAADGDGAQLPFGGIVRQAEASVIEEAGERIPTLEQIVDRLAGVVLLRDFGTLLAQPHLQFADKREAVLLSHAQPPLRHQPIDPALDGEKGIDALDRFGCDRRFAEPREIKELAPAMGPTRGLDDRASLAARLIEAFASKLSYSLNAVYSPRGANAKLTTIRFGGSWPLADRLRPLRH